MLTGKTIYPVGAKPVAPRASGATISVLIPSRGDIKKPVDTVQRLFDMADNPDAVEVFVRRDADEQVLLPELKNVTFIIGKRWGYVNIHRYYQECFRLSTGNLVWIFDDDTHVQTQDWDTLYADALRPLKFGVCSSIAVEDGYGSNAGYPWAVPVMTRALAEKYAWQVTNTERVMDAYAQISQKGISVPVTVRHRNRDKNCPERAGHYAAVVNNFSEKRVQWLEQAKILFESTL